ncbi:alpha/beta fold hydrolase [Actinokineospora sp. G85]|uniref:alpha/beta fold hydrolase n=1 Tax=Actinokineospora sp. G85 TaxID=3406626 RepID=UPI003C73CD88
MTTVERSYVDEVADLVLLHARAQGMTPARAEAVLAGVDRVDSDGPGSWSHAWTAAGDAALAAGDPLNACRRYNLARFPYPATDGQRAALTSCVAAFDEWRAAQGGIERRELDVLGVRLPVWASGLDTTRRKPLLLIIGGIVSIKEQWGQFLVAAGKLGMAVVVTEMPGVGENPLRYRPDSHRMLAAVADAVAEITPVTDVYSVAMSFGGTMALGWAARDPRVKGVLTVGAPIRPFFTDAAWWPGVPETTKRTLAHVTGRPDIDDALPAYALTRDELADVRARVGYVVSRRDEIVPAADSTLLAAAVPDLALLAFDDVHGSPAHLTDTKLWITRSLLTWSKGPSAVTAALGLVLKLRNKGRLTTSR